MKHYPLRKDVEHIDICECGHQNNDHSMRMREILILWNADFTGECSICICPKYKKEKSMIASDFKRQSNRSGEQ